ncbi:magnesium transporter MRS2-4-like isoform X1 [Pyrus x bretschneideri]|uniref:magnesium transporter MRS2-4-like isoform X1 n=1 Tax=Pyrus x bretschneideri TaxID=225117 RepID=UPI00202F33C2|nr:magnesium transporter MRS2-4-like isoform X1 [Pyrus x bretschneideri]
MGKGPFSFKRSSSIRRRPPKKFIGPPPSPFPSPPQPFRSPPLSNVHINSTNTNNNNNNLNAVVAGGGGVKGKKKAGGARLWMRFDRFGGSELVECDKNAIIRRAAIPARDLRILGPVFSHSSSILAREKAMVVNLEFIKAIVTAEEVLLLDPLRQEVLPFADQLRQQLPQKRQSRIEEASPLDELASGMIVSSGKQWLPVPEAVEGVQCDLPFEFQVLEIALEVVCTYLNSSVADLEREAYPVLDELARNVSTKNLELVRSLKSILTRLLGRVQKVRDELEHLLDDNEDMAHLYLTRKWMQNQQPEALLGRSASNSISAPYLRRLSSNRSGSLVNGNNMDYDDVEDLEMLLEAYFMQLDGTRNKILSVREYIDDTEDYVNIQLDNQRNELIQLQLTLTIASFAIAVETLISGIFGGRSCLIHESSLSSVVDSTQIRKLIYEPLTSGFVSKLVFTCCMSTRSFFTDFRTSYAARFISNYTACRLV